MRTALGWKVRSVFNASHSSTNAKSMPIGKWLALPTGTTQAVYGNHRFAELGWLSSYDTNMWSVTRPLDAVNWGRNSKAGPVSPARFPFSKTETHAFLQSMASHVLAGIFGQSSGIAAAGFFPGFFPRGRMSS